MDGHSQRNYSERYTAEMRKDTSADEKEKEVGQVSSTGDPQTIAVRTARLLRIAPTMDSTL